MIRVAILAYACKSGSGSEPGAGFQWALAAAQSAKVEIITRPLDQQTRIELAAAGIRAHELEVQHLKSVPQLSYVRWLLQAQRKLIELHKADPFELVHHLTYATDWLPAPRLKDIPLVWGPVGGSTGLPPELAGLFSRKLRIKEAFRSTTTSVVRAFTLKWAARYVDTLIAQNQDTAQSFATVRRIYVRPNYIVTPLQDVPALPNRDKNVAVVGRLIEMKGVHIAIAAMAAEELRPWTLHIIGDGPMRKSLESQAKALNLSDRVVFHGNIPRNEVYRQLSNARCSLLLSTHDAAGWSAAESISVGTPVHTWAHGGPAELVSLTGCGTTTLPGPDGISALSSAIAGTSLQPPADMTRFYFDSLARELRTWYDEAIR